MHAVRRDAFADPPEKHEGRGGGVKTSIISLNEHDNIDAFLTFFDVLSRHSLNELASSLSQSCF